MSKRAIALDGVPEFPPEPEQAATVTPGSDGLGIASYVIIGGGGGTNHAPGAYWGGGGGGSYTVGGGGNGGAWQSVVQQVVVTQLAQEELDEAVDDGDWGTVEQTTVIQNNGDDVHEGDIRQLAPLGGPVSMEVFLGGQWVEIHSMASQSTVITNNVGNLPADLDTEHGMGSLPQPGSSNTPWLTAIKNWLAK